MIRRELKLTGVVLVAFTVVCAGLMIGLSRLGAPDELTAVLVVGVFAVAMLPGGFHPDESPPDRR
jgi:hypothetical protein